MPRRRSPRKHTVHPKNPRYNVNQYGRGQGDLVTGKPNSQLHHRKYPKRNFDEKIIDWEPLVAHGQKAIFKRTWKHYYGDKVRFYVLNHTDWDQPRIYAVVKKKDYDTFQRKQAVKMNRDKRTL